MSTPPSTSRSWKPPVEWGPPAGDWLARHAGGGSWEFNASKVETCELALPSAKCQQSHKEVDDTSKAKRGEDAAVGADGALRRSDSVGGGLRQRTGSEAASAEDAADGGARAGAVAAGAA
eukprot:CAMPEP_0203912452 /NCGR_PEP_ID=MMETSP0359-20131031/53525_1 /ASSEMBLY_ACC=CAM_ASM_000338 /TAXON_ID=268821 /ORGANISM="Scrippsiella Hangoei, Strain SHTV-5" /LENGTH=119 /DNA_ID=CAMNT_0050838393 /DNA_START=27 /DNA_END=382 /DNA_ORIENTATION=+